MAARDTSLTGSNALLVYFIVSTYAFGDLMNHALVSRPRSRPRERSSRKCRSPCILCKVTRVGQTPFPTFYSNRGAWLLIIFYVAITAGAEWAFLKWVVAALAFATHTQYSAMMGSAIAGCLGISFFKIKPAPAKPAGTTPPV